ncbi:MAG: hypothetical protein Q9174_005619 [Haloplaca sp. 1 TL-2023]
MTRTSAPIPTVSSRLKPGDIVERYRPRGRALAQYETYYRNLHRDPELSQQERMTSLGAAQTIMVSDDFRVYTDIGGHGFIGVLDNGAGPTVLLRADMDALPVRENTGLEYASQKMMNDADGNDVPVMHACGHDVHVTCLLGAAKLLYDAREYWKGTLICLLQPAEELVSGAQAMVDDGLYTNYGIPNPDVVLGQHVFLLYKAGTIGLSSGAIMAAVDGLKIRVFGKGGHGSMPNTCVDPIVIASHIIVRLQTIVSRELQPGKVGVVTCGKIQAGTAANIIPDYADMELTIRSYDVDVQKQLLDAIKRIVRAECDASKSPKQPEISKTAHAPATVNSLEQTDILQSSFSTYFDDNLGPMEPLPGSEDFSVLARAINRPYVFWALGGCDPDRWDKANNNGKLGELPSNHSAEFAPVIQPTLKTGIDALALAALTFLN